MDPARSLLLIAALFSASDSWTTEQRGLLRELQDTLSRFPPSDESEIYSAVEDRLDTRLSGSKRRSAAALADSWMNAGLSAMWRMESMPGSPPLTVLYTLGDTTLLKLSTWSILHSRCSKTIHPETKWLRLTQEIFRSERSDDALVASYDAAGYEMSALMRKGKPLVIVCPEPLPFTLSKRFAAFTEKYAGFFEYRQTLFVSPFSPVCSLSRSERMPIRDSWVAALSRRIYVGQVRKGGVMERIVRLRMETAPSSVRLPPTIPEKAPFSEAVPAQDDSKDENTPRFKDFTHQGDYLFHYTRAFPGPWPGQSLANYYASVAQNREGCRHTALDTLLRILTERRIRGGHGMIYRSIPVTPFTELGPNELREIIHWRPGLLRWSFEPYGIAFPRKDLESLGAREVVYQSKAAAHSMNPEDMHLHQAEAWRDEREWRIKGDLVIDRQLWDALVVIVPTAGEAACVKKLGCAVTLGTTFTAKEKKKK